MTPSQHRQALPSFLIIGAMKAGTTSLYHYLKSHPQIHMSRIKELDFFVTELNWGRGLDWYSQQFSGIGTNVLAAGEASTNYTKYPRYKGVPERISMTLRKHVSYTSCAIRSSACGPTTSTASR
jgi:hypothetical protein